MDTQLRSIALQIMYTFELHGTGLWIPDTYSNLCSDHYDIARLCLQKLHEELHPQLPPHMKNFKEFVMGMRGSFEEVRNERTKLLEEACYPRGFAFPYNTSDFLTPPFEIPKDVFTAVEKNRRAAFGSHFSKTGKVFLLSDGYERDDPMYNHGRDESDAAA